MEEAGVSKRSTEVGEGKDNQASEARKYGGSVVKYETG
jgi:hypothetical protein